MILNLGRAGKTLWIGDGFCDDANNIEDCNYDGSDCCGISVQKNFCVNCTCTGRCKLILSMDYFVFAISCMSLFFETLIFLIYLDKLDCYSDAYCHGSGFCRQGKCMCPSEYNYKKDCSIYGCKYKNLVMEVFHGYILFHWWQMFVLFLSWAFFFVFDYISIQCFLSSWTF